MARKLLLIALVALIVGGIYLYQNLGSIVTRQAEQIASDALGVKVTIGGIDLLLSDKKVVVNTIKIANPAGYTTPYAIAADKIEIGLNTASSDFIDFKNISVLGSVVNFEVNERGANILDLKNLANRKKQRENVGSKQVRVIVQHMVIDSSTINPTISVLRGVSTPIHMPAIQFSNIGSGGGMDAGDALTQIMTKYFSAIQNAAQNGGLLKNVPNVDDVKKTLDGAAGGIKNLFQ